MRLAIFGGTFDPIHLGHLIIAQRAAEQLRLDRLLIIPAFTAPHKRGVASGSPRDRLAMAHLAVRDNPLLEVSDIEIRRKGLSYTVDTIEELRRRYLRAHITIVIGGDSLRDLPTWREPKSLARHPVAVAARGDIPTRVAGFRIIRLETPLMEISSTDIRRRIARKMSIRYIVHPAVEAYIVRKGLYRNER